MGPVAPPARIAAQIERDATILADGARDAPPRHRSLDNAMAHSWRLASARERAAVEALSVFASPFPVDLAVEVAEVGPVVLRRLVDRSLLHRRSDGRYASHPLVRQYAAARLASDDPRRQAVRRRHARAVLGQLAGDGAGERAGFEDVVRAWRSASSMRSCDLLGSAAEPMADLLDAAGRYRVGLQLLRDALAVVERGGTPDPATLAALRWGESWLLYRLGHHREAAAAAEAARRGHRRRGGAAGRPRRPRVRLGPQVDPR